MLAAAVRLPCDMLLPSPKIVFSCAVQRPMSFRIAWHVKRPWRIRSPAPYVALKRFERTVVRCVRFGVRTRCACRSDRHAAHNGVPCSGRAPGALWAHVSGAQSWDMYFVHVPGMVSEPTLGAHSRHCKFRRYRPEAPRKLLARLETGSTPGVRFGCAQVWRLASPGLGVERQPRRSLKQAISVSYIQVGIGAPCPRDGLRNRGNILWSGSLKRGLVRCPATGWKCSALL